MVVVTQHQNKFFTYGKIDVDVLVKFRDPEG
jgi:hypothetical protein